MTNAHTERSIGILKHKEIVQSPMVEVCNFNGDSKLNFEPKTYSDIKKNITKYLPIYYIGQRLNKQ